MIIFEGGHRGVELGTSKFASQRNAHAGARQFFEFGATSSAKLTPSNIIAR